MKGLTTIRAFRAEANYEEKLILHLDDHSEAWLAFVAATRWLGLVLDWTAVVFLTMVLGIVMLSNLGNHAMNNVNAAIGNEI
jgi:hypothetical protein